MLERLLAKRHIASLDLTSVRLKLRDDLGWTYEKTGEVELEYRRFLYALARKRPQFIISPPTQDVDEFWHRHILDTRRYREDCDKVFGHYMDHTPGLTPEEQTQADARRRMVYDDDGIDVVFFDSDSDSDGSNSHHDHNAEGGHHRR